MPTPRRSTFAATILVVLVALVATSCAGSAGDPAERASHPTAGATTSIAPPRPRPTADVDRSVALDDGHVHVRCRGAGASTVVLFAGFTAASDTWDPVVEDIAEHARVCSYDRYGTGTSDPAPTPQTFETQARTLHQALEAIDEPGPYVAVGHSFGGLVAASYTALYPGDVQGLLLLDASPAGWDRALCSVPDLDTDATRSWRSTCATQASPAANVESLDGPAAFAAAARIDDLGSVPMIVDQVRKDDMVSGLPVAVGQRLTRAWTDGQRRWAGLSTQSTLELVEGSGHDIHHDRPEVVVAQVAQLVDRG